MSEETPPARPRRRRLRAILALASLAVGLVLAEGLGRLLNDDVFLQRRMRDGGVLVPYEPNAEADLLADEFRVRFRINRHGHRDRTDRTEARVPGKGRVLLLGDSFSAGWGVAQEETYAYRLEDALGVEVVNAARSGGCPLLYIPQARDLLPRFRPDALLVQIYDNDPENNATHQGRLGVKDLRFHALPKALRPRDDAGATLTRAFTGLALRRALRNGKKWLLGEPITRSPFVTPGGRSSQRLLTRAEAIAAHAVDLSPGSGGPYHDAAAEQSAAFVLHRALLVQLIEETRAAKVPLAFVYVPNYSVFLGAPQASSPDARVLAAVCAAAKIPLFDGTTLLGTAPAPVELYHAHDGHLNAAGHAHLAKTLAPLLRDAFGF